MKKNLLVFTACICLMVCVSSWLGHSGSCALCNSCPYHEPCIISLATGDIIPLTFYDPHPFRAGDLAEEQTDGYSSLIYYPSFSGWRDTNSRETIGNVQAASAAPLRRALCPSCRKKLKVYSETRFVLADLRKVENPVFYPLEDGAEVDFRCYKITVTLEPEENTFSISVQGTI